MNDGIKNKLDEITNNSSSNSLKISYKVYTGFTSHYSSTPGIITTISNYFLNYSLNI